MSDTLEEIRNMKPLDKLVRKYMWGHHVNGTWFFHGEPKLDEAQQELSALRSEIARLKAEREWQPIETAPIGKVLIVSYGVGISNVCFLNETQKQDYVKEFQTAMFILMPLPILHPNHRRRNDPYLVLEIPPSRKKRSAV